MKSGYNDLSFQHHLKLSSHPLARQYSHFERWEPTFEQFCNCVSMNPLVIQNFM